MIAFPPLQGLRWPTDADALRGGGMAGRCLTMSLRILDHAHAGVGPDRWCLDGPSFSWERLGHGFEDDAGVPPPTLHPYGRWRDGWDGGVAVFADGTVLVGRSEHGTYLWAPFPFVQTSRALDLDPAHVEANLVAIHTTMAAMPPLAHAPDAVTFDAARYHAPWAGWTGDVRGRRTADTALRFALLWSQTALPHPSWPDARAVLEGTYPKVDGTWGPVEAKLHTKGMRPEALDAWNQAATAWVLEAHAWKGDTVPVCWHPLMGSHARRAGSATPDSHHADTATAHERLAWERQGGAARFAAWARAHPDAFGQT